MSRPLALAALGTALALSLPLHAQPASPSVAAAPMIAADPARTVSFEIYLPLRDPAGLHAFLDQQQTPGHTNYQRWLTPAQFAERFGPSPAAMARATAAARAAGLNVVAVHGQSIEVAAPVAMVNRAFATTLMAHNDAKAPMLAREAMRIPDALKAEGAMVVAFKSRWQPRPFLRITDRAPRAAFAPGTRPFSRLGLTGPYFYNDLKQAYDYPAYTSSVRGQPLDGTGASVAIVISNDVLDSDIQAQFDDQGFTKTTGKLAPKVNRLLVNGGSPFDQTLSGESSLDVEQALGGAPGAAVTLVNLPTLSNEDVIAGYRAVVEANRFDIVSSSFGQCELFFGPAYNGGVDASDTYKVQEQLFMQGNAQGITFVASSGDGGALSCASTDIVAGSTADATLGVNYPASSAFVTSVGGGNLVTTGNFRTTESRYRAENGLGDPEIPSPVFGGNTVIEGAIFGAGGGRSALFAMPAWQRQVGLSGKARAQPDVGFFVGGCPGIAVQPCGPDRSGAILYVGGQVARVIGTSVAAPQFAGALALVRQFKGQRLGNINPLLYARAAQQNRAVTAPGLQPYNRGQAGFDGVYFANQPSVRYNYIFGNGSMNIRTLFEMTGLAPAGNPKSPSNP